MGASIHWKLSSLDRMHTLYFFRKANCSDRIGALGTNGTFYWMISAETLRDWVEEGGYVMDDLDNEYSIEDFIGIVEKTFQILDNADVVPQGTSEAQYDQY